MLRGGSPTIYVSDLNKAVDFYTKSIGLRLQFRAGDHFAQIDAGGGFSLGLHPQSPHGPKPGAHGAISVGFSVTQPLDQVITTLKQRGVVFRGPIIDDANGSIRLAFFGDPDGNDLYLCENKRAGGSRSV